MGSWGAALRPLIIAALMMAVAVSARAADTGTVSGAVFDRSGKPVADAVVKISGDRLPVGRTVQTDANGLYRFEYLLPGDYTIAFSKDAVGNVTRTAVVELGKDIQVDAILG